MPETVPVRPADLLIDEQNPRIAQPNTGQHRALQALAQHLGRKLQVLAADMVRHGLNPAELPIVMPLASNPSRYVVLEGNRRLAALRALENPESLVDATKPGVLRQIRRLSRAYQENPIETVTCSVVKDRDEARHWIELRHTGENAGAGIVPWGSDEAARYRARTGVAQVHSQALDFLQRRGDLTAESRSKVPATSLKRLIETPEVRSKLGVEVRSGVLYLLADEKRVAKALMHIVNDLADGTTKVGDIYTKQKRLKYANDLPAEIVVASTVKSGEGIPAGAGVAPAKPKPGARSPKKRDRLIPRDCVLNIPNGRIHDIEIELRKLSLEDHTNAVSVLFRVFIELSAESYIESRALGISLDSALQKKLEKAVGDLVIRKKLTAKQATPVRRACQKDSFLAPSVTLMHQYVHNPHVFPAPGDQRAHWDSLQPFIAAMWTP
jgi:hypothetical protein